MNKDSVILNIIIIFNILTYSWLLIIIRLDFIFTEVNIFDLRLVGLHPKRLFSFCESF